VEQTQDTPRRSGVVVLIGRSNVGKSTLLNALVGTKIAITTPRPQTTRVPIQGVVTRGLSQIIFVDTPGVLVRTPDTVTRKMTQSINESLEGIDVILHVVDPTRRIGEEEDRAQRLTMSVPIPRILVINKIDVHDAPSRAEYRRLADRFDDMVEVSALRGTNVGAVIEKIIPLLPEGEFLYPEGQLTNVPNRLWLAELVREKLFLHLRQELPYAAGVEITSLEERENGVLFIAATIFTTSERYQRMIIGAGGRKLKEIGRDARTEMEVAMNRRIFLELVVSVDRHWMERID
jgi:GTP-binding protein Era